MGEGWSFTVIDQLNALGTYLKAKIKNNRKCQASKFFAKINHVARKEWYAFVIGFIWAKTEALALPQMTK